MALEDLTTEELHERIDADRAEYVNAIPEKDPAGAIKLYRDYVKGKQKCTILAAVADEYLEGTPNHLFSDNVLHEVTSQAADRLELLGFSVEAADTQKFLDEEIYVKNHLSDLSGETHYSALRDGDFALLPEWNEKQKRIFIHKEDWWDGDEGVFVAYVRHEAVYAVKDWVEIENKNKVYRRNVYFDDRIERFKSTGGGKWEVFNLEGEEPGAVRWLKKNGDPLHIPVVHFPNAGRSTGDFGFSEIGGGVVGNQDGMNDKRYDIDVNCRMTAYQMITASGYTPEKTGNPPIPVSPRIGPRAFLWSPRPETKFDSIEAGDGTQLENAYMLTLKAICRMTRTPLHTIVGDWPSGEALLRAELPAVNKARRQVAKFTTAWATLAHRCVEISNALGLTSLNEEAMITPLFAPVTQLGELQKAMSQREFWTAAGLAIQAGYPLTMYLEDEGWDADKIAKLKAETARMEADARDEEEATVDRMIRQAEAEAEIARKNGRIAA